MGRMSVCAPRVWSRGLAATCSWPLPPPLPHLSCRCTSCRGTNGRTGQLKRLALVYLGLAAAVLLVTLVVPRACYTSCLALCRSRHTATHTAAVGRSSATACVAWPAVGAWGIRIRECVLCGCAGLCLAGQGSLPLGASSILPLGRDGPLLGTGCTCGYRVRAGCSSLSHHLRVLMLAPPHRICRLLFANSPVPEVIAGAIRGRRTTGTAPLPCKVSSSVSSPPADVSSPPCATSHANAPVPVSPARGVLLGCEPEERRSRLSMPWWQAWQCATSHSTGRFRSGSLILLPAFDAINSADNFIVAWDQSNTFECDYRRNLDTYEFVDRCFLLTVLPCHLRFDSLLCYGCATTYA